jgi:TPR repeat protein
MRLKFHRRSRRSVQIESELNDAYSAAIRLDDCGGSKVAFDLLVVLAEHGHASAINVIASHYLEGKFVERNVKEALRLYRYAAKQGETMALWNCALALRDDAYKPKEAVKIFLRLQGCARYRSMATIELARAFQSGVGVRKDLRKSYALLLSIKPSQRNYRHLSEQEREDFLLLRREVRAAIKFDTEKHNRASS